MFLIFCVFWTFLCLLDVFVSFSHLLDILRIFFPSLEHVVFEFLDVKRKTGLIVSKFQAQIKE